MLASSSDKPDRSVAPAALFVIACLCPGWGHAREPGDTPGRPAFGAPSSEQQETRGLADLIATSAGAGTSAAAGAGTRLTMIDAIGLALDGNLGIKSAYLGRIADGTALATAEDKFSPTLSLTGSAKGEGGDTSTTTITRTPSGAPQTVMFDDVRSRDSTVTWNTSLGPAVTWLLPTGANLQLNLQLEADDLAQQETGTSGGKEKDVGVGASVGFSIAQPLLKGAGVDLNNASVRIARLNDRQKVLALKSVVENTVSQAIQDYRAVVQEKAKTKIAQEALASSANNLANVKTMVEEGRLPRAGLIQYETDIRQDRISLRQAEASLENARRSLAKTLGRSLDSRLDTLDSDPEINKIALNAEQALNVALAHRGDYKTAVLQKEAAELALSLAENNLLWDVSLVAGAVANVGDTRSHSYWVGSNITRSTARSDQTGWNVGVNVVIPIDDNNQAKRAVTEARVALLQADVTVQDTLQGAALEVRNAINNLNSAWDQVELSDQAQQLAGQQYEIAREELKYGRITNFEVIALDDAFQDSKVQKLDARINYLNAVTALDLALGTTLRTWNIEIENPAP